jgi:hypothetical protein
MRATFLTQNLQIQMLGSIDEDDPQWDGAIASSRGGLLIGTARNDVPFDVEFFIGDEPSPSEDIFFSTTVAVPPEGMELCLIQEADQELPSATVGNYLRLPWSGPTLIQLTAPTGFESDSEGTPVPRSLEAYLSPSR